MWHEQWELFAPNFKDGKAHIDLTPYGVSQELRLLPGPGFGDFSHPTTRLCLKLLSTRVKNHIVIDIGCGSGILSLAAALLGADMVYGIDIDSAALKHSNNNLILNSLQNKVHFSKRLPCLPTKQPLLIVMNMIPSEQNIAWKYQNISYDSIVTSGVLKSFQTDYLAWTQRQGWQLADIQEDGDWLAFSFY